MELLAAALGHNLDLGEVAPILGLVVCGHHPYFSDRVYGGLEGNGVVLRGVQVRDAIHREVRPAKGVAVNLQDLRSARAAGFGRHIADAALREVRSPEVDPGNSLQHGEHVAAPDGDTLHLGSVNELGIIARGSLYRSEEHTSELQSLRHLV